MNKKNASSPRAPKKTAAGGKAGRGSPGRARSPAAKGPPPASKILGILESQRQLGGASYPPTLARLVELTGGTLASVGKELARKEVKARALLSRTGKTEKAAPEATLVLLVEDAELIARSEHLLGLQLGLARTNQVRAVDAGALCKGLARPLAAPFKEALGRFIEERRTPPGIGALPGKKPLFFLVADAILPPTPPSPAKMAAFGGAASSDSFAERFDAAFSALDRDSGGDNYITLHALRGALPDVSRASFDAGLSALRRGRRYTLDPSDGRHHQMSEAERDAGIMEAGSLLVYVARRGDA